MPQPSVLVYEFLLRTPRSCGCPSVSFLSVSIACHHFAHQPWKHSCNLLLCSGVLLVQYKFTKSVKRSEWTVSCHYTWSLAARTVPWDTEPGRQKHTETKIAFSISCVCSWVHHAWNCNRLLHNSFHNYIPLINTSAFYVTQEDSERMTAVGHAPHVRRGKFYINFTTISRFYYSTI